MIYTPLDMPFNLSTYGFQSHCGSADTTLRTNLEQADKQKQLVRNRRMTVNVKEPYRHTYQKSKSYHFVERVANM